MGATGQVGGFALQYLKEAKVNVRAVLRDSTKSADVLAAGNINIHIDCTSLLITICVLINKYVMINRCNINSHW